MGHLVPPRHRQRALTAALLLALAALLVLLPAQAEGQLPTVSVPSTSLPTVSVPTVTTTIPTVTVPTITTTTPTVTTPTVSVPTVDLPGGTISTPTVPDTGSVTIPDTSGSGLPVIGGGGGGSGGGGSNEGGSTGTGSSSGGAGGGGAGSSGSVARVGGGSISAADAAAVAAAGTNLFGGSGGSNGAAGGGSLGGAGGIGGAGGAGGDGGGTPLLGIPVLPGGGTPGVTPLAALLASHTIPPAADQRGFAADVGHAITQFVDALPDWSRPVIGVLLALVLVLLFRSFLAGRRTRRLERQRESLEGDVAALQAALLADVPARLDSLAASVAYRSADGPATGGDFYDAFALADGRMAVIVGDASGHGREAISRSASVRYTLRAYLDAGLEPNAALGVAGRALESDSLDGEFATAVVAVYDGRAGTLSYACAGHPPPIVTGTTHEPITACAAPPIGWGVPTGLRLTTIPFPAGALACFFTDGLVEARDHGELFGRERLAQLVVDLHPDDDAEALLDRLRHCVDDASDDMATLVLRGTRTAAAPGPQVEELEIEPPDLTAGSAARFLEACGVEPAGVDYVLSKATPIVGEHGAATLRISLGDTLRVHVLPPSARTLEPRPAGAPAAEEPPKITH